MGTIDKFLSEGIMEDWPIEKRNWAGEVGSFSYCVFSPDYHNPRVPWVGLRIGTW